MLTKVVFNQWLEAIGTFPEKLTKSLVSGNFSHDLTDVFFC